MASRFLSMLAVVTVAVFCVEAIPQCLKFRWLGQEGSSMQGIRIAGTESYSEQVAYLENKTNADDCFYDCCVRAVQADSCNAASFYKDAEGNRHCFLLFCDPFTDCQWTLSYDSEHTSAFMTVVRESAGQNIQKIAENIEAALEWNILYEDTTTSSTTSTTTQGHISTTESLTDVMDSQVKVTNIPAGAANPTHVTTTQPPVETTQPPVVTTMEQKHETESIGVTPTRIEWPSVTGTADEGMGENVDTGDSVDAVGDASHKSSGAEEEKDGVNKTAIVVCSLGGVALLVAGVVIAIKRYQVEKDRSVYRPLMDDIHNRGFKESDPLH